MPVPLIDGYECVASNRLEDSTPLRQLPNPTCGAEDHQTPTLALRIRELVMDLDDVAPAERQRVRQTLNAILGS